MNNLTLGRFLASISLLFPLLAGAVSAQDCVAYQINASHTGATVMPGFSGPLEQKWSIDMGSALSYPLLADGKVFATTKNTSGYGLQIHGIDASTGTRIWSAPVPAVYFAGEACYSNGRLFVYSNKVTSQPTLDALDSNTGTRLWSQRLTGQYMFSSPPTAGNGMVYIGGAGSGGTLYALSQSDGREMWRASVENGDHSSPVVTPDGVYVSYVGPQTYKFDPFTGRQIWHYSGPVEGGGGKTAVLYGGNLYVRDAFSPDFESHSGLVLDAVTGRLKNMFAPGYFASTPAPAFDDGIGYFLEGGALIARSASTNSEMWRRTNSAFVSAPLVINGTVYEGTADGMIYGCNGLTGDLVQTLSAGAAISWPDEHNVSAPLTGFGAGNGLFVVSAGRRLVAFGPKGPVVPEPGTMTLLLVGAVAALLKRWAKSDRHYVEGAEGG